MFDSPMHSEPGPTPQPMMYDPEAEAAVRERLHSTADLLRLRIEGVEPSDDREAMRRRLDEIRRLLDGCA